MGLRKIIDSLTGKSSDPYQEREDGSSRSEKNRFRPVADPPPADAGKSRPASNSSTQTGSQGRVPTPTPADPLRSIRNDPANPRDRHRADFAQQIESIFSAYGPDICAYIFSRTYQRGGSARLVEKLHMTPTGREASELAQVAAWIAKHGADKFRELARIGKNPGAGPAPTPPPEDPAPKLKVKPIKVRDPRTPTPLSVGSNHSKGPVERISIDERPRPRPAPAQRDGADSPASPNRKICVKPIGLSGQVREVEERSQKVTPEVPSSPPQRPPVAPATPPKGIPLPQTGQKQQPAGDGPEALLRDQLEQESRFDDEERERRRRKEAGKARG